MAFPPVVLYAVSAVAVIAIAVACYLFILLRRREKILSIVEPLSRQWLDGSIQNFFDGLLTALHTKTDADTVCVLVEADAVTAEIVAAKPANPLASTYVSPDMYAEAIERDECLFIEDYPRYGRALYTLSALPTASAIIAPFRYESRTGVILFLWKEKQRFSRSFRNHFNQLCRHLEPHMRMYEIISRCGLLQARYDAMLATMSQAIVLIDGGNVSAWINATAGQLFGLPPGPTEPYRISAAMNRLTSSAANPEAIRTALVSIGRDPKSVISNLEWASSAPDGPVLRVSSRPISSGAVESGRLWMFDDITQLKHAEAELQRAHTELMDAMRQMEKINNKLVHLNQEKDDFLSIAAHDLKNPLSGILGISQIMAEDVDILSKEEIREYSQLVVGRSNTMFRLITDLLSVNTLESGAMPLHVEPCDPDEVVSDVIRSNTPAASAKNIVLDYTEGASYSSVRADQRSTHQILDNLISNAVKYSPVGSTVRVSLTANNGTVRYAVKDEGPGFSDEDHSKMFGRFTRLSSMPTGGESSNGLGLYIVRKLTESMHGRVWCESKPGEGATFFVELPGSKISG